MPAPVSKKQARFMHAIMAGKVKGDSGRGAPPKAIAEKYAGHDEKNLPEQSGENSGGTWTAGHHESHAAGKPHKSEKKKEDKSKSKSKKHVRKSLEDMLADESLEKNIVRSTVGSDVVHDMTHGDALKLVGNGTFRFLREITKDMKDEDFKDVAVDSHKVSIRKHSNDVYSGRVTDGHKLVHQWTNKSLPAMAADLMSVFEWYSPEDEGKLDALIDEGMSDGDIHGGMQTLLDNYKKHNLANIYTEMENIRVEMRNGVAVDIQQIEQRIMKLFDKLESKLGTHSTQHNRLAGDVGDEIDKVHGKLRELQEKIDSLSHSPAKVEAFSSNPANPNVVHNDSYMYLSKPQVTIHPDGRIQISFGQDWASMERDNFLHDMRAKALKKAKK
jgi:hypothetical protein